MNQQELYSLMQYAEANHIQNKPFQEVYQLWLKDNEEAYREEEADSWLSSMEAQDDYLEAI